MSKEDEPKKAAKKKATKKPAPKKKVMKKPATAKKPVKKPVTKKKAAAKPVDIESIKADESKIEDKTAKTLEKHDEHPPMPYLQVFIALFVLTIIEVGFGRLDTSAFKVAILLILAIAKVSMITAIFMHVRYDKNPTSIVIIAFALPLLGALILSTTIWADY